MRIGTCNAWKKAETSYMYKYFVYPYILNNAFDKNILHSVYPADNKIFSEAMRYWLERGGGAGAPKSGTKSDNSAHLEVMGL